MRVSDTGRDHILISCHVRIQRLVDIVRRLGQCAVERLGVRCPEIEEIHGAVQYLLDIPAVLVILLHPGKRCQRHPQIIVELLDPVIDLLHLHDQVELRVQDPRVRLQPDLEHIALLRGRGQKDIPVVHIDTLHHFPVHKQQKLWVLRIIPLVDLRAHMKPHPLSVQLMRHTVCRLEPVVTVFPIPVHLLAVKIFPRCRVRLRFLRTYIVPFLVLPIVNGKLLPDLELFELFANHIDSLIQKMHILPPFLHCHAEDSHIFYRIIKMILRRPIPPFSGADSPCTRIRSQRCGEGLPRAPRCATGS